jgi:hypothetical protein
MTRRRQGVYVSSAEVLFSYFAQPEGRHDHAMSDLQLVIVTVYEKRFFNLMTVFMISIMLYLVLYHRRVVRLYNKRLV